MSIHPLVSPIAKPFRQAIPFFKIIKSLWLCCLLCVSFSSLQAQVIISEVYANSTFKLKNTGTSSVNLTNYWICNLPTYMLISNLNIECGNLNLAAGAEVVLSASNFYATTDGELGLYSTRSFSSSTAIVSYVEWGSAGGGRSSVAVAKGIWDGNAATAFSASQSLKVSGNGTSAADWSINPNPQICVVPATTARYKVTFDAIWSNATHPTDFPSNPHFSGLIGMTHNSEVALFELGMLASPGIIAMAEFGSKNSLITEITTAINSGNGQTQISGGGIGTSPGTVFVEFGIDSAHPLVSLTSMIAPSPDWFVGVRDFNLFENNNWATSKTVQIGVYDAGSDSGVSFQSGNAATNPKESISMITTSPLAVNGVVPSMGTMTFERIDVDVNCLPTRQVADIIETGTYSASATLSSTGTIASGKMVTFRAGESITLLPNFHAAMGSDFTAKIEDCSAVFVVGQPEVAQVFNQKNNLDNQTSLLEGTTDKPTLLVQPNPVKTTGQLLINLPEATSVQLTLYNLTGQAVSSLLMKPYQDAGTYSVPFDVTALPNGIYSAVLRTDKGQLTRKILVLSF